eukprot:NODE_21_length_42443_cov_0.822808.p33 type:complete len:142 gc:universal NODE_21_length_42443_cov_0.822808:24720-25145(+)
MKLFVDTKGLPALSLVNFDSYIAINSPVDLMNFDPESLVQFLTVNFAVVDIFPWLFLFHHQNLKEVLNYCTKLINLNVGLILHINDAEQLQIFYFLMEYATSYEIYKRFESGETNYRADGELLKDGERQLVKLGKRKIKII